MFMIYLWLDSSHFGQITESSAFICFATAKKLNDKFYFEWKTNWLEFNWRGWGKLFKTENAPNLKKIRIIEIKIFCFLKTEDFSKKKNENFSFYKIWRDWTFVENESFNEEIFRKHKHRKDFLFLVKKTHFKHWSSFQNGKFELEIVSNFFQMKWRKF